MPMGPGRPSSLRRGAGVALATLALHVGAAALLSGSGGTPGRQAAAVAPQPLWVRLLPAAQPQPAQPPALAAQATWRARGSTEAPAAPSTRGDGAPPDPQFARFLPDSALQRGALPVSQPDLDAIEGLQFSGLPIRLRLFIDESGRVVRIDTLRGSADDAEAIERLKRMFAATAFVPGRLAGRDVASYQDLDFRAEAI